MLQPYHQELLVSSLLPGQHSLGWSRKKAFFKSYRSPELRITRQFDHNCVCMRRAKRFLQKVFKLSHLPRYMECLDFSSDPFAFFFLVIFTPVVILLRPTEKD